MESSFKKALSRSEDKNRLSSPSTLEVVKELARYYIKVNKYLKAELLYKHVFVAIQEQEGLWNPKTATILQLIAEAAVRQGHYVEATECLLRVEVIQKAAIGINHLETLSMQASITILFDKQEHWQDAEKLYKDVITEREALLGANDEETLKIIENLALSYWMRGTKVSLQAAEEYKKVLLHQKEKLQQYISGQQEGSHEKAQSRLAATMLKLVALYNEMGSTKLQQELLKDYSKYLSQSSTKGESPEEVSAILY